MPPLSYYVEIINNNNFKNIYLIAEDTLNPCINSLLNMYPNIIFKINTLDDYNKLLSDVSFWKKIKEENCLLFQYDAISFGKFSDDFLKYNYIGAKWDNNILLYQKLSFGNGGISFRKTRIMEYICDKYKNDLLFPEDVFFCVKLNDENLLYCPNFILDTFSFENIYNENTIYGHSIYNYMSYEKLEWFIEMKIDKLIQICFCISVPFPSFFKQEVEN
jgi:hypothetical protein